MNQTMTEAQFAILRLLYEQAQLTTRQIWQHLYPQRPKRYIERELSRLEEQRLIKAHFVCDAPSRRRPGETQPLAGRGYTHQWMLLQGGARLLGVPFGNQHYRRRSSTQLSYRQVLRNIERQVLAVGWKYIAPVYYSARRPRPPICTSQDLI